MNIISPANLRRPDGEIAFLPGWVKERATPLTTATKPAQLVAGNT
jgi:hypothetical protein